MHVLLHQGALYSLRDRCFGASRMARRSVLVSAANVSRWGAESPLTQGDNTFVKRRE